MKTIKAVLKYAKDKGFEIREGKHYVLRRGDKVVTVSRTPTCPFAVKNAMSDIRRALKSL